MSARQTFEIVASGFNGGTDATDDRILWVFADDRSQLEKAIGDARVEVVPQLLGKYSKEDGVDFDVSVPAEAQALRERLHYFATTPSKRRIKVTVHEQIVEDTVIEIEVPADVDLEDDVVRMEFLERIWCGGEYKKLDLESQLQITDREFSEPVLLT